MKSPLATLCAAALAFGALAPSALSADNDKEKDKGINSDKAREMLDKLVDQAQKAASKIESKGKDSKDLWAHSKETMRLSKDEYLHKVNSAFATMTAELQGLAESDAAVLSRDYFKTLMDSLKQHLEYCKRDADRLKDTSSDEAFRVKQKGFDRTLGFLSDGIELAKQQAGL